MVLWLMACAPSVEVEMQGVRPAMSQVMFFVTDPEDDLQTRLHDQLIDHINTARHTIDVAIYDFGQAAPAHALVQAADRGVDVRVVTDGDELDSAGIEILESAGISVEARPAGSRIMHHKFAVFDEHRVWTGSTNWTETGFTMNNNNAISIHSPGLAAQYTEEMEQLLDGNFGRHKDPSSASKPITLIQGQQVHARFSPQDSPADDLVEIISQAERSIYFMVFSFTRSDVVSALVAAQERGVNVVGIFDESQARMSYSVDEQLAEAGIPVYIDGNSNTSGYAGGKLHHKVLIVDPWMSPLVVTGSMNWSTNGNDDNDENMLIISDSRYARAMRREFCAQLSIATVHPDASEASVYCPSVKGAAPSGDPTAIQINELLPDPSGTDRGQEFVEIVNTGEEVVSIEDWTITDSQGHIRHTFSGRLQPLGALVLFDEGNHDDVPGAVSSTTGYLSLNNGGDTITLRDADGDTVDAFTYEHSDTGVSWNREEDGAASETVTWVKHSTLSELDCSPGTLSDGSSF